MTDQDHDHDVELKKRALRNVASLVEKLEHEGPALSRHKEKQLLLLLGVVGIAVVGFVGLSMMMGSPKEKDLARHRCETDLQVKLVWDYTQKVKNETPGLAPLDLARRIDEQRPAIRGAAKAACAKAK